MISAIKTKQTMQIIVIARQFVLNQFLNLLRKIIFLDLSISRVRLPISFIVREDKMLKGVDM